MSAPELEVLGGPRDGDRLPDTGGRELFVLVRTPYVTFEGGKALPHKAKPPLDVYRRVRMMRGHGPGVPAEDLGEHWVYEGRR